MKRVLGIAAFGCGLAGVECRRWVPAYETLGVMPLLGQSPMPTEAPRLEEGALVERATYQSTCAYVDGSAGQFCRAGCAFEGCSNPLIKINRFIVHPLPGVFSPMIIPMLGAAIRPRLIAPSGQHATPCHSRPSSRPTMASLFGGKCSPGITTWWIVEGLISSQRSVRISQLHTVCLRRKQPLGLCPLGLRRCAGNRYDLLEPNRHTDCHDYSTSNEV